MFCYNNQKINNYILKKMSMQPEPIAIQTLIKSLTFLAHKSTQILHMSTMKQPSISYKENEDPVTQIDHTIQKLISKVLQKQYPLLTIIGEQCIDQMMIDQEILQSVLNNYNGDDLFLSQFCQKVIGEVEQFEVCEDEISVFVDPLDCTRGWVSGKKWECTVLIGVVYKNVPIFGIIGQPFRQTGQLSYTYEPRLLIGGTVFSSQNYISYELKKWQKCSLPSVSTSPVQVPVITTSSRRSNQTQQSLLQQLGATVLHTGGSGNKLSMLIRGEVDAILFIGCPLSSWDCCAGEAIVRGLKGFITKPDRSQLTYKSGKGNKEEQTYQEGIICTLEKGLYERIAEGISEIVNI